MTHAKWLESTLNRRYRTIVIVSSKILNHQKDYFFKSTEALSLVAEVCIYFFTSIQNSIISS